MEEHCYIFQKHISALQNQQPLTDEQLLQRIDALVDRIFDGLEKGKMDYLTMIVDQDEQNMAATFNFDTFQFELPQENSQQTVKRQKLNKSLKQFCRYLQILKIVISSIKNNHFKSKREIFYENPDLFENQIYLNCIVKKLAYTLQVPRRQLHIVSATKGLVSGPLKLTNYQDNLTLDISCLSFQKKGFNITEFMDYWDEFYISGSCILIVEKETIYFKLLDEQNQSFLNQFLIITGKGYPCQATQQFIKLISIMNKHIPVYYIGDMDPHGFDILCLYAFGNGSLIFEQANVPWIKWINIRLQFNNLEKAIPMSDRERIVLQNLLNRPYFEQDLIQEWKWWKIKMNEVLNSNTKYELESICDKQSLSELILQSL